MKKVHRDKFNTKNVIFIYESFIFKAKFTFKVVVNDTLNNKSLNKIR